MGGDLPGQPQCGLCSSCLLRRQALHSAGLAEYDRRSRYRKDVMEPHPGLKSGQLYAFNAMLYQRDKVARALSSPDPWMGLVCRFPGLLDVLSHVDLSGQAPLFPEQELIALYRRYCDEWDHLSFGPDLARLAA